MGYTKREWIDRDFPQKLTQLEGISVTDYVFDECATVLFSRLNDLEKAVTVCESIKKVKMLPINGSLFEKSWQIFKKQKGTKFNFTDCTILALMEEEGINNLATFDKDFEKISSISIIK